MATYLDKLGHFTFTHDRISWRRHLFGCEDTIPTLRAPLRCGVDPSVHLLQTSTGVHGASPSTVANFSAATAAKIFIAAEQPAPSSAATEFTMAKADRVSLLQARACVRTVFSLLGLRKRHTSGYMHVHPICCDDPARKLRLGRGRAT